MSSPAAMVRYQQVDEGGGLDFAAPANGVSAEPGARAVRGLLRAVRGRYPLVIVLGLICGALGGWAGFKSQQPLYRSEGLLRIAYALPEVMKQTDQNQPMASFDAFMRSQQLLITSQRLVHKALSDPAWVATGRELSPRTVKKFVDNLTVDVKPKTENISISFMDSDPTVAAAGVRAIVDAYSEVYSSEQLERLRFKLLEDRRKSLSANLQASEAKLKACVDKFGTASVEPLYEAAVQRIAKLDAALTDIRMAPAVVIAPSAPATQPSGTVLAGVSVEQIAAVDPGMRTYLDDERRLEADLAGLRSRGLREAHPQMIQLKALLNAAQARVRDYTFEYQTLRSVTGPAVGAGPAIGLIGRTQAELDQAEAKISRMLADAKKEMTQLDEQRNQLSVLQVQVTRQRKELSDADERLQVLQIEDAMGGRLMVISSGEVPLTPFNQKRLQMGMVGGAVGGGLFPLFALVALARINRRFRYIDEAEDDLRSNARLLGVLPSLDPKARDGAAALVAAQCVHQMRVNLQVSRTPDARQVYMLTSAGPGEGKTSLTISLGLSFAAAGLRTLLIDCDLAGRRLTRGFRAEGAAGLREALCSGSLKGCLRRAEQGLYVLTAGIADGHDGAAVSVASMRRVLEAARGAFEVVLIDAGPLLGCVEASAVAREADGVIACIAQGQRPDLVRAMLRQLSSLGARVEGFVFNRASARDFNRYPYGSSMCSSSGSRVLRRPVIRSSAFGPLVDAVAASLPSWGRSDN